MEQGCVILGCGGALVVAGVLGGAWAIGALMSSPARYRPRTMIKEVDGRWYGRVRSGFCDDDGWMEYWADMDSAGYASREQCEEACRLFLAPRIEKARQLAAQFYRGTWRDESGNVVLTIGERMAAFWRSL